MLDQTIRSDNGKEFKSKEILDLYSSLGVKQQLAYPYTPEKNARVERKHRNILNVARALQMQTTIPLKLWGNCILAAVFLINRTPSKTIENITP